jgi:hypothetical protein
MDSRKPQLKVMGVLLSTMLMWVACTGPDGSAPHAPDGGASDGSAPDGGAPDGSTSDGGVCTDSARIDSARIDSAGSDEGHQGQQGMKLYDIHPSFNESLEIPFGSAWYRYGDTWIPFTVTIHQGQLTGDVLLSPIDTMILAGDGFNDVRFIVPSVPGLGPVTLSLSRAQPHQNVYDDSLTSNTRWDYQVKWSLDEREWKNLCPNGASAIVVPYTGRLGSIFPSSGSNAFSFACLPQPQCGGRRYLGGGVAAKCADWGYSPWRTGDPGPDGQPLAVMVDDDQAALRHHVACTAMATADYCGEGTPRTLNNTSIFMFNTGDVKATPVGDPPESYVSTAPVVSTDPMGVSHNFFFEAAWKVDMDKVQAPNGRTMMKLRAQALCLTKKRWSTMPVDACVTGNLLDPRGKGASYCEDISMDELLGQGAVLFSYSMFMDAGLYRFKNSVNGEFLTTADVVFDPDPTVPFPESYHPNVDDWDQYTLDTGAPFYFEGTILTQDALVAGTFSTVESHLKKLSRCKDPSSGGYITMMEGAGVPAIECTLEGYVSARPMGSARKLMLWKQRESYVTSVNDLAPGYSSEGEQGYLPSLMDYAQELP